MEALGCSVVWAALLIMQCYEPNDCKPKTDNLAFIKLINQLIDKLTDYLVSSFIKGWSRHCA